MKSYFFKKSKANFRKVSISDEEWSKMRSQEIYTAWHALHPSKSEFLISEEGEDWFLYRRAEKWGKIENCNWTLDEKKPTGKMLVGKINLKDLQNV